MHEDASLETVLKIRQEKYIQYRRELVSSFPKQTCGF